MKGRPDRGGPHKSYIRSESRVIRMLLGTGVDVPTSIAGRYCSAGVIQGETKKVPRGDLKKFYYYTCITYLVIDYGIEPLLS